MEYLYFFHLFLALHIAMNFFGYCLFERPCIIEAVLQCLLYQVRQWPADPFKKYLEKTFSPAPDHPFNNQFCFVSTSQRAKTAKKKSQCLPKANKSLFKGQCPPQELQVDLHIILLFIVALNVVFLTFIYL